MAVSRPLRRLLGVLELEEEQSRQALESSIGDLRRFEQLLTLVRKKERAGRALVVVSAHTGELPDRLAGLEESRSARRSTVVLEARILDAETQVTELREAYLTKRVERRQAETIIQEIESRDAATAARRGQQALDDWFLNRIHATKSRIDHERARPQSENLENSQPNLEETLPELI
jgi:sirohydrochlorin ferrochelatase